MSLIDEIVDKFLQWKLPKDFNPDCGISFDSSYSPIGTNLFTADQAKEMFTELIESHTVSPESVEKAMKDAAINNQRGIHIDLFDFKSVSKAIANNLLRPVNTHNELYVCQCGLKTDQPAGLEGHFCEKARPEIIERQEETIKKQGLKIAELLKENIRLRKDEERQIADQKEVIEKIELLAGEQNYNNIKSAYQRTILILKEHWGRR